MTGFARFKCAMINPLHSLSFVGFNYYPPSDKGHGNEDVSGSKTCISQFQQSLLFISQASPLPTYA
jgi:hypothetical protein